MNVLSIAEIKRQIPEEYTEVKEKSYWAVFNQTKDVRRMFGKSLIPLTSARIDKLKGSAVYVVDGEAWENFNPKDTREKKMEAVWKMRILDPDTMTSTEKSSFDWLKRGKKGIRFEDRSWKRASWPIYNEKGIGCCISYQTDQCSIGRFPIWIFASDA